MNSKALIFGLLCIGLGTAGNVEGAAAAAAAPEAGAKALAVKQQLGRPRSGSLGDNDSRLSRIKVDQLAAMQIQNGVIQAQIGALDAQVRRAISQAPAQAAQQIPQPPQALWRRGLQFGFMGLQYWLMIQQGYPLAIAMYQWAESKTAAGKRREAEAYVRKQEMLHANNAKIIADNVEALTRMAAQRDQLKTRLAAKPDEGLAPILVTLTRQVNEDTAVITKQIADQNKLAAKLNKLLAARAE